MRLTRQSLRGIIMEEVQKASKRKNSRKRGLRESVSLDLGSIYDALESLGDLANEAEIDLMNGEVEDAVSKISDVQHTIRDIMLSIDHMGAGQDGFAAPYPNAA